MIPSAEQIIAGFPFVARRFGLPGGMRQALVREAVDEARSLSSRSTLDEPAALFFAFASRPGAFDQGWRVMPRVISGAHAATLGLRLDADAQSTDALCADVAFGTSRFDSVRDWFSDHLKPLG